MLYDSIGEMKESDIAVHPFIYADMCHNLGRITYGTTHGAGRGSRRDREVEIKRHHERTLPKESSLKKVSDKVIML